MATVFDRNLLPEFDAIKDENEIILWVGKPKFIPFLFSKPYQWIYLFFFGLFWVCFNGLVNKEKTDSFIEDYFWIIGAIPFIQGLYFIVVRIFSFSNTAYAYSDKRVMMRTGFVGTDFKTVDYDKISDIEVTVNAIERFYNVGTIQFFSGRTQTSDNGTSRIYDYWSAIENPYEVFKTVKQTSVDVKTDFNYPNALRPETNPGYKTRYEREE